MDLVASVEVSLGFSGGFDDLGDIFSSFFGGGGSRRNPNAPRQGEDLLHRIRISFEDAVFGTKKTIKIRKDVECDHCHGSGAKRFFICKHMSQM